MKGTPVMNIGKHIKHHNYTMQTCDAKSTTLRNVYSEKDVRVTIDSNFNFWKTYTDPCPQGKPTSKTGETPILPHGQQNIHFSNL